MGSAHKIPANMVHEADFVVQLNSQEVRTLTNFGAIGSTVGFLFAQKCTNQTHIPPCGGYESRQDKRVMLMIVAIILLILVARDRECVKEIVERIVNQLVNRTSEATPVHESVRKLLGEQKMLSGTCMLRGKSRYTRRDGISFLAKSQTFRRSVFQSDMIPAAWLAAEEDK